VLDSGLSLAGVDGMIEVVGHSVDVVKLGWGTAVATGNLGPKLARYRQHNIPVVLGGTLTEVFIRQNRVDDLVDWLRELGLTHVEVSDGTISLAHSDKVALIQRLATEFTVFSEVGSKDSTTADITPPYQFVEQIERELAAGAWKVIAEGRETGTAGIYRSDGQPRMGLIEEVVHSIDPVKLVFDAPRKDQQVWFLRRFGPEVNFGNIAPDDVLSLETLRLGLRSDTVGAFDSEPSP
jgi:phosphosulfolactate synthase